MKIGKLCQGENWGFLAKVELVIVLVKYRIIIVGKTLMWELPLSIKESISAMHTYMMITMNVNSVV